MHHKYDKDWIHFTWIVREDDKMGNNFLSPKYDIYIQRGENDRELVVRQVSDMTLVQIYRTDFEIIKPDVFFSDNNIYVLVTENKNVDLFNNLSGELIDSFLIQDDKVKSVLFIEEEQIFFLITVVGKEDYRISKYDMSSGQLVGEKLWTNTLLFGETADMDYYLGFDFKTKGLFAASLSNLEEEPVYGEEALQLCQDGVSSIVFDKEGKYYLELSTSYSTHIQVKECISSKIIYNVNVYDLKEFFFDEQDHLYIVHEGCVDEIDLLTGKRKIIVDLSTIAERKGEERIKEDYDFVTCCRIHNSRYLAGIVYELLYNYNRIYIFDMDTEEIVAMSNSLGELSENGYAQIVELNEILYATIIGDSGNSAIYYPLSFDDEGNLVFSEQ